MIYSGLVSITFRQLKPQDIVNLVRQAGLEGIEWAGEVHVPHGNLQAAREVYKMTTDAGLRVASYGSYYHAGHKEDFSFEDVLQTAIELHAPTIRVWAGKKASAEADAKYRDNVIRESRKIADMAAAAGKTVSYEFHGGTLTDSNSSALRFLKEVKHDKVKSYWQPATGCEVDYALEGLDNILPWLSNVHVFHWLPPYERLPLAEGKEPWSHYLKLIASTGRDHFSMLEFVKKDDPEMFLRDAETLRGWLGHFNSARGER